MHKSRFSTVLRVCAIAGIAAALAGCMMSPGMMMSSPGQPSTRVRGPGADGTEDVTLLELQMRMFDLADLWASLVKSVGDPILAETTDPKIRGAVVQMKLRATISGYAIGASADPVGGILDMMVLSRLFHKATAPGARQYANFGTAAQAVASGMARADESIWRHAERTLTPEQQAKLESKIDWWYESNPNITFVSFARLNDIDAVFSENLKREVNQSQGLMQGLMQALDAALRSANEYRLLGERSLWLAARAPILIRLSTEATLQTISEEPAVGEALGSLDAMPKVVDRLISSINGLPVILSEQRKDFVQAIDAASRSLEPLVRESRAVVDRTEDVLKEARALASEPNASVVTAAGVAKDLREAAESLEAIAVRFAPPAGQDPKNSGQTMADLARAAEQINAAMTTLGVITKRGDESPFAEISKLADLRVVQAEHAGRELITFAFWRLAILIAGDFGLMLAYRAILSRWFVQPTPGAQ